MIALLKDKRFSFLLLATLISSIGTGISSIAVPWLFVKHENGSQALGYTILFISIFLFFSSPYIGAIIDKYSRKKVLYLSQLLCGSIQCLVLAYLLFNGENIWQLVVMNFTSAIFFSVVNPAITAYIQEMYTESQYDTINSIMEIIRQTAPVLSGGLSVFIVDKVSLASIILIDITTYFFGFILFLVLPYNKKKLKSTRIKSLWVNIKEGISYVKVKKEIFWFFLCTTIPYVSLMIGNYLHPIYISQFLKAPASVYASQEMIIAIGAICSGVLIKLLILKLGLFRSIFLNALLFTLSLIMMIFIPVVTVYLCLSFLIGFSNAGVRVARYTMMMKIIPNYTIGRIESLYNGIGLILRVTIIGLFTQTINFLGAPYALGITGLLILLSLVGLSLNFKKLNYEL